MTKQPRGAFYWIVVGWWWGPLKWAGRVGLWLIMWPIGLWRSVVHGQNKRERRASS